MICRMCLREPIDYYNIFENEGTELEIAKLIAKYFWFKLVEDDPISTCICMGCWEQITDFHKYYCEVEQAQSRYSDKNFDGEEMMVVDYKEEAFPQLKVNETDEKLMGNVRRSARFLVSFKETIGKENLESEINGNGKKRARDKSKSIHNLDAEKRIQQRNEKPKNNMPVTDNNVNKRPLRKSRQLAAAIKSEENKEAISNIQNLDKKEKVRQISGCSEYTKKSKEHDEYIAKHMKLKCELCPQEYITFAEIRVHYRLSHKCKGYILCCNKKFYRRILLLEHINKHLNPEYFRCQLCDKICSDRQCLKSHMITMHEPEERKVHKCDQCPKSYSKRYMLVRHKLIHIPQEERKFFCKECGKAFPVESLLLSHTRQVHENAYGIMCHICAKVCQGKTMLAKHQLEHLGVVEPQFQCTECGSWLKHKYSLKKHMERHAERHEEELNPQKNICNICGKISPSKSGLRSHINYAHKAKRMHQCNICKRSFKRVLTLKEHMTTHTGEILYTCPHCPQTFNSSANMHSHRKKRHRKEWEENRKKRELAKVLLKIQASVNDQVEILQELPNEVSCDENNEGKVNQTEDDENKCSEKDYTTDSV